MFREKGGADGWLRKRLHNIWEQARKFDLDHCDLQTMLWNVAVGLRVLTLNIETKYNKGIPLHYYIVTAVMAISFVYAYLVSMLWFVFVRCQETGDLIAAMVVLSLGISTEIGPLKLLYMFVYVDNVKKIADDYLDYDAQTVKGTRFHMKQLKVLRIVKKRAIIYWMVIIGNGIAYLLKPFLMPGKNLPENYFTLYGLEPKFETPYYELTFTVSAIGVAFICYVPAFVTPYLIVIAGFTESQLLALSEEIRQIWPDAVRHAKNKTRIADFNRFEAKSSIFINKFIKQKLKVIIVCHAQLISLFHNVENVFRGSIAIGFFLIMLGLLVELLGKLENTYLQMPFAIMQVAMDCYTGQRVMDASVVFEQAVYDCQWENFDNANMKMVQVMLLSSQKTMTLSAGGMATLSYACLMTITRGIYSAYTALRSAI